MTSPVELPDPGTTPSPLASPRLRRIILAYTVNRLGNWFGLVALLVAVFDHTHDPFAVAAVIFAWQALPAFLVPPLVARVEASKRRGELTALYVFEAVVTAALAVLLWNFALVPILVLAAIDGTAALAASALVRSEVARAARGQVPPDGDEAARHHAERKANAALNVAYSTTFVLGPALAGVVVAAAGSSAGLFIDVASFLIGGALLIDLHPHVEEAGGDSVRARLHAAWAHVQRTPTLRGLLSAEAVALVFFETGAPIEISYAKATLHAGDRGVGLLLTAWGAGAILGSAGFARLVRRPLATPLLAGTVAIGAGYIGFALAPSLAPACAAALVGGIGNGMQWPSLISAVQRMTPQSLQGRLMGGVESLGALCRAIGLPLGGALAALTSPRLAFVIVGCGAIATVPMLLPHVLRMPSPKSSGGRRTAADGPAAP